MKEEKEELNKKVVDWVIGGVLGLIISNLGVQEMINPKQYTGAIAVVVGFIVIYFSFYLYQIKGNGKEIKELKEKIEDIEEKNIIKEKLLNDIRDIIIVGNIKNEQKRKN